MIDFRNPAEKYTHMMVCSSCCTPLVCVREALWAAKCPWCDCMEAYDVREIYMPVHEAEAAEVANKYGWTLLLARALQCDMQELNQLAREWAVESCKRQDVDRAEFVRLMRFGATVSEKVANAMTSKGLVS